jgi:sugar-specific transcriptional regulator TrmB
LEIEECEIAALRRLGLSEYESRIYLVLVRMGTIKASEISFFGQVPRTKTYGAIKELERKGLLRMIPGKPEGYAPRSPSEVLMPLVVKLTRELKDTEEVVQALSLAFESSRFVKTEGPKEAAEFWTIDNRQSILNKLNQFFGNAVKAINCCTSASGLVRAYKAHSETFEKARKRGATVRILAPITRENYAVAREISEIVDFKRLDKSFGEDFVTVDSKELVVIEAKPEDVRTDRGADNAIWTTNRLLVELHEQLFDRVWNAIPGSESEENSEWSHLPKPVRSRSL